jgi:hypothetical protein
MARVRTAASSLPLFQDVASMKKTVPLLLAILLAGAALPAAADDASFNGVALAEIRLAPVDRAATPARGDVRLVRSGVLAASRIAGAPSAMAEHGLALIGTIGTDAALVVVEDPATARAAPVDMVPVAPGWKLQRNLRMAFAEATPAAEIQMIVHTAGDPGELAARLAADPRLAVSGITHRSIGGRVGIRVNGPDAQEVAAALAEDPLVYSIERGSGAKLLNSTARRIVQSARTDEAGGDTMWQRGLHGEGQIIAILDTGADYRSCYLSEDDISPPPVNLGTSVGNIDLSRRKIIAYDMLFAGDTPAGGTAAYDNQGHGTYVAGNAGASQRSNQLGVATQNGPAPRAKFVIQDGGFTTLDDCSDLAALGCPLIDITPILEQAYAQGARIHNNSWGDRENFPTQNDYSATCVDVDDMTWRNPDFLFVAAAGNSGPGIDTVGSPSVAKNALSVGGTQNGTGNEMNTIISFSSRGWAEDLRIKPDVVAPARTTTSTRSGTTSAAEFCSTALVQGTSMASPMTSGAVALARQYLTEGWHIQGAATPADAIPNPSAALLKAVVIAGAARVTGDATAPPSRNQGWGRVKLDDSLFFAGEERLLVIEDRHAFFASSLDPAYELLLESDGNTNGGTLNFVLAWSDYPATVGASPTLVNNLDLEIEAPGGTVYRGNVFSGGVSQAGGAADTRNNVEVVRLPAAAGSWRVTVKPTTILQPGQGFALAVTGDLRRAATASVGEAWMLQ